MKKIISLAMVFMTSLIVFAGCGYSGGSTVTGIAFSSPVYYVDRNVPFKLNYRIFPSSADTSNYSVYFETHDTVNLGKYSLNHTEGIITVTNRNFTSIEVGVKCGILTDTCKIYLKQYPERVYFNDSTVELSAGAITELVAYSEFADGTKRFDTSFYNIVATSSDPTVVTVVDSSKLLVKSTGRRGNATISFKVCNSDGQQVGNLESSVNVSISNNVEGSIIKLGNNYIRDFSQIIELSSVKNEEISINPLFLDKDGYVVSDENYSIISMNDKVATIIEEQGEYRIKILDAGNAKIVVSSGVYDDNGDLVVFILNLSVIIAT